MVSREEKSVKSMLNLDDTQLGSLWEPGQMCWGSFLGIDMEVAA